MSKIHVSQIEGYLTKNATAVVDMSDWSAHKEQNQIRLAFLSRALAMLAVSSVAEVDLSELGPYVTDGGDDGGIDLIYFDPKEKMLYLVQSKWHEDGQGSISQGDALKFIDGVRQILDNNLGALNQRIRSRGTDIERALFDASAKFTLLIAHTGQANLGQQVQDSLDRYVESQNDSSELMYLKVLNQGDLHKAVASGLAGAPISLDVQLVGWNQLRDPFGAIYGQVYASDVARWMAEYGNRLFERNIRQFLGASLVNQDMVSTLTAAPENFWYFNNGITVIVTDLAKKPIGGQSTESGIFECTGFCIVNGAQTVGSIHAAHLQDPDAVARAKVSVRVISVSAGPAGFGALVTRFTNTQNAIEKRDFVALDPNQERIRQECHIDGVEYAYKAGKQSGGGQGPSFDLVEATVSLACINSDVGLSTQAKREIGRLWEDLDKAPYLQLFNGSITGPALWQAVQTLRLIDQRLQGYARAPGGRDSLICVHGNRFIEWCAFRRLGMKTGDSMPSEQTVFDAVDASVKATLANVKAKYADNYPASLFKNAAKCRVLAESVIESFAN